MDARELSGSSPADCLSTEERLDRHLAELTATKGGHEAGPEWSAEGIRVLVEDGSPAHELWEGADSYVRDEHRNLVLVVPGSSNDEEGVEPTRCPRCGAVGADVFSHDCFWVEAKRSRQLGLYELARRRVVSRPRGTARRSRGRPIRRRGSCRSTATRAGPDSGDPHLDDEPPGERRLLIARREAPITDPRGQSVAEWRTPQASAYLAVMALHDLADELRRQHGLSQAEADAVVLEAYFAWHAEQGGGRPR